MNFHHHLRERRRENLDISQTNIHSSAPVQSKKKTSNALPAPCISRNWSVIPSVYCLGGKSGLMEMDFFCWSANFVRLQKACKWDVCMFACLSVCACMSLKLMTRCCPPLCSHPFPSPILICAGWVLPTGPAISLWKWNFSARAMFILMILSGGGGGVRFGGKKAKIFE